MKKVNSLNSLCSQCLGDSYGFGIYFWCIGLIFLESLCMFFVKCIWLNPLWFIIARHVLAHIFYAKVFWTSFIVWLLWLFFFFSLQRTPLAKSGCWRSWPGKNWHWKSGKWHLLQWFCQVWIMTISFDNIVCVFFLLCKLSR